MLFWLFCSKIWDKKGCGTMRTKLLLKGVLGCLECDAWVSIVAGGKTICSDVSYNIISKVEALNMAEYTIKCITALDKKNYKIYVAEREREENFIKNESDSKISRK